MTQQEAYLASGIRARKGRDHSIWIVGPNDKLLPTPVVIPPQARMATVTTNATQCLESRSCSFAMYFDADDHVTKVVPCAASDCSELVAGSERNGTRG